MRASDLRPRPAHVVLPALLAASLLLTLLASCGGQGPATPTAPAAPTNVTATPGPGYITVAWTDNSDDETRFDVYRNSVGTLSAQQAGTKIGSVGADETSFVDLDIAIDQAYSYSVVAANDAGASGGTAAPGSASVTPHVDLMMGTTRLRFTDDWVSTLFVAYLVFPLETLNSNDVSVRIDGPAGWNGGAPIVRDYPCGPGETCWVDWFVFGNYAGVEALTGDYELTVTIGADTYTAGAHLDASFRYPRPGNLTASGASSSGVTVSWVNPADTRMNVVSMRRGDYESTVVGYQTFFATTYTYEGLDLEDGEYGVEIVAMNADIRVHPVKVEPFAQSYEYVQFTVGD